MQLCVLRYLGRTLSDVKEVPVHVLRYIAKQINTDEESFASYGELNIPPAGDIKPMKGYVGLYRLRISTFRVLFEINHNEKVIYIQAINSRGGVYK